MNEFQIGTDRVVGGYHAWIRKVHRADNEVIKGKGGHPVIYPTKAEAKAAAGEAMVAYINGSLTSSGCKITGAKAAAERIFRKGGKVIEVEHRGARA